MKSELNVSQILSDLNMELLGVNERRQRSHNYVVEKTVISSILTASNVV